MNVRVISSRTNLKSVRGWEWGASIVAAHQRGFEIEADCNRDFFMTAEEAVDYGIIDKMIPTKTSHITKPPIPILSHF